MAIHFNMFGLLRLQIFRHNFLLKRSFNKIVITDDGSTIVALHKEQEFPYEFSKPLPMEVKEDNSILKMSDPKEVKRVFKEMKPEMALKQLASLTCTTVHRWYPRARDKKFRPRQANRPYL